ncbi:MAG: hypothetical protein HKL95_03025 [Phycisphaerae bacterium]|nr:hypothetical protein [Phycisphaerae bacterium]
MLLHQDVGFHNVTQLGPADGGGLYLQRFPDPVRSKLIPLGRMVSAESSGVELRFVTDSPNFCLAVSSRPSVLSPFETHLQDMSIFRGAFVHSHHRLDPGKINRINVVNIGNVEKFNEIEESHRTACGFSWRVWRILFGRYPAIYLGLDTYGAPRRPPLATEVPTRRWLAYGSSITHGGSATLHHGAYIYHAARIAGLDVLNQGLSGSCQCEAHMADYFAARSDWDIITLEIGVNLRPSTSPQEYFRRVSYMLEKLRQTHPNAPIVLLTIFPNATSADYTAGTNAVSTESECQFNAILREFVGGGAASNVYLIEGHELLDNFGDLSVDLIHPSDYGHARMGENLGLRLRRILDTTGPDPLCAA